MPVTTPSLQARFEARLAAGRKLLIPYLTAGYPDRGASLELMSALVEEGADVLELGVPFSDPLADGPTIQRASYQALQGGMTVRGTLDILARFRRHHDTPVVLFSYLNPILRFGVGGFLEAAVESGAQGLLLTDLPAGADPDLEGRIGGSGLDLIRLIAPTTPPGRVRAAAAGARGFLYYISRTGVTGARIGLREELRAEVEALRPLVELPIAVGFGISTPSQAAAVAAVAEGVVVGSALLDTLDREGLEGARLFLRSLRAAMDGRSA